jgi:hypothetical protein
MKFTLILRMSGNRPERKICPAIDVLRAELDAFVDALLGKRPFPVPEATLLAFEGAL